MIKRLFVALLILLGFAACTKTGLVTGTDNGDEAVLERFAFTPDDNGSMDDNMCSLLNSFLNYFKK